MLYKFDRYWKMFFIMLGAWIVNAVCGFEFTVVSLLTIIAMKSLFSR
jgi:hypothetical protein